MPTYEVVRGDTVWALTRRALTEQLGRAPSNREILEVVNQVQVPSGNVDLIFPGEQITIPVGPGYQDGGRPGGAGATPRQTPDSPQGVRPQPGRPDGGIYTGIDSPAERRAGQGGGPSLADRSGAWTSGRQPAPSSMDRLQGANTPQERLEFLFGGPSGAALAAGPGSMPMPNLAQMSPEERTQYAALQALQGAGMAAGLGGLYAMGAGAPAAPAAAAGPRAVSEASLRAGRNVIPTSTSLRPPVRALPSGARPALPAGPSGPLALGPGPAAAAPRAIPQASVAAPSLPVSTSLGFRIPPPAGTFGAIERRLLMGPGGYAY